MPTEPHPFEQAGMGKAPFRYIGLIDQPTDAAGMVILSEQDGVSFTTNPGGTCDYCGLAIIDMFHVRSSDGNTFKVGSSCINKVDARLKEVIKPDIKRLKASRDKARIAAARIALPSAVSLTSKPHPNANAAKAGRTLRDYCEWMLANAGTTGRLAAARIIEKALKP